MTKANGFWRKKNAPEKNRTHFYSGRELQLFLANEPVD